MKIESMHAGEFLLSEGAGNISREASTLQPGQPWSRARSSA